MGGKHDRRWVGLALLLALLAPGIAQAGPYFGEWGWWWHPAPGCPRGNYCALHYHTPYLYRVIYCWHRPNLDQYPPGLPVPVLWPKYAFVCRTIPPVPTPPYADPAGYFGRPIVPSEGEQEKKEDATGKKVGAAEKK